MRAFLPGWLIAGMMLFSGCASVDTVSSESNVVVHWELVTNFLETPGSFEARFVLKNSSELALADDNWALFFNMAPRPILPDKTPQPAQVKHLNGDWYKLV
ncbi:MAG TPA: beta-N-acetylhexosaminidase, partial [Chryseosolibacter sp.]|nr:beta-N-acetylhexosaminidase [Chryseosolibacter sp.]